MCESFSHIQLSVPYILNMDKLKCILREVNNVLFIPYGNLNENHRDVSYKVIPGVNIKIGVINKESILTIVSTMKSNTENITMAKLMKSIITNNDDIFQLSEILSHGIIFPEALEQLKTIVMQLNQYLDTVSTEHCDNRSDIVQIELEDHHVGYIIAKILGNISKKIILIASSSRRSVLSAFLLVHFLHKESPDLKHKITFICPDIPSIFADSIICTDSWLNSNRYAFMRDKSINVELDERKSCFIIFNSSNMFITVENYVSLLGGTSSLTRKIPTLCLVQENCYTQFVKLLKDQLEKSAEIELLDRNRQISLNYCENPSDIDSLLKSITDERNIGILSSCQPCRDNRSFYQSFVLDNCQPQQPLFSDKLANRFCRFLLTFRTCQEGIMLANQIYKERDSVYLWTESISQCFAVKNELKYDHIFVNIGPNNLCSTGESISKYRCDGAFFVEKKPADDGALALSSDAIAARMAQQRNVSKWRFESFHYRYQSIMKTLKRLIRKDFVSVAGGALFEHYLESRVKPFEFNYFVEDSLNKLMESVPIGGVLVDLGDIEIDDRALLSILLILLFGNDVLVTAVGDLGRVHPCLTEDGAIVSIERGCIDLRSVDRCGGAIDVAVCFDRSVAQRGYIDGLGSMRVLSVAPSIRAVDDEWLDEVVAAVRRKKALHILSGDVGIN